MADGTPRCFGRDRGRAAADRQNRFCFHRGALWFAVVGLCNGLAVLAMYTALKYGPIVRCEGKNDRDSDGCFGPAPGRLRNEYTIEGTEPDVQAKSAQVPILSGRQLF